MSCGRTTTRRQAHAKRRTTVFLGHTLGVPSGSAGAVTAVKKRAAPKPKPTPLSHLFAFPGGSGPAVRRAAVAKKKHPTVDAVKCQKKKRANVGKGKRIVITQPLRKKAAKAVKASKKSSAAKAVKALKGLCLPFA